MPQKLGRPLAIAGILLGVVVAIPGWQVRNLVQPPRLPIEINPADLMINVEEVEFSAADGVPLKGWYLAGRPGAPGILLCHGLGANRAAPLNMVLPLRKAGYHVLLFDFRAHGESAGMRSTLGIDEAQDVLGAADHLISRQGVNGKRLGGWGRDIGAYALLLAARERPEIRALALDNLFPEPRFLIGERLFSGTGPLRAPLSWLAGLEFEIAFGPRHPQPDATAGLESLAERSLLLVVSRQDERQTQAARGLLAMTPEGKDGEKSLLELEASWSQTLYGEDRERYEREMSRFFRRALPPDSSAGDERKPVIVMEG